MVVAPAQVLRYRLFSAVAIVWALSLFGTDGWSPKRVREHVSPWRVVGATAARSWKTLRDWVEAARAGRLLPLRGLAGAKPRQLASAAVVLLRTLALPGQRQESEAQQAVSGALQLLMGITP